MIPSGIKKNFQQHHQVFAFDWLTVSKEVTSHHRNFLRFFEIAILTGCNFFKKEVSYSQPFCETILYNWVQILCALNTGFLTSKKIFLTRTAWHVVEESDIKKSHLKVLSNVFQSPIQQVVKSKLLKTKENTQTISKIV